MWTGSWNSSWALRSVGRSRTISTSQLFTLHVAGIILWTVGLVLSFKSNFHVTGTFLPGETVQHSTCNIWFHQVESCKVGLDKNERKTNSQPSRKKVSIKWWLAVCPFYRVFLSFMMNGCLLLKVHGQGLHVSITFNNLHYIMYPPHVTPNLQTHGTTTTSHMPMYERIRSG